MKDCESVREWFALSAAGMLDAAQERRVAEHARECPECAAELALLSEIVGEVGRMPAQSPSPDLVFQTQMLVAAEADRRDGARMAIVATALAWAIGIATWEVGRWIGGVNPMWIWMAWAAAVVAAGSTAGAVLVSRRTEGIGR